MESGTSLYVILFWASIFLVLCNYFGYIILLRIAVLFRSQKIDKAEIEPSVSIIIAAYNEEVSIADKLDNTLCLDYPKDKLEIIVVSDGSTDATDQYVGSYANKGVKLIRTNERCGKTHAQNLAAEKARGDILVFSDATTEYKSDVIRKLVRNFNDKKVGCVAGRVVFKQSSDTRLHEELQMHRS